MAMKRVEGTGRFAAEAKATEGDPKRRAETKQRSAEDASGVSRKAPRPAFCRVFARARMAEALPKLVDQLLEKAREGSLPHLKLLVQMSGLDTGEVVPQAGRRKGKSLEAVLKERWALDRKEQERMKTEQKATDPEPCLVDNGRLTAGDRRVDEG